LENTDPPVHRRLRTMVIKSFTASVIRAMVPQITQADTQLGDRSIAEGDLVMAFLGAANRDPEVYENPDRLDVRRDPKHVTFGHGVHFCVGAGLTRIEAPIAINELLARFPRLRLVADTVEWKPNIVFRGLTALPLELT
jgi:cytochrome P450